MICNSTSSKQHCTQISSQPTIDWRSQDSASPSRFQAVTNWPKQLFCRPTYCNRKGGGTGNWPSDFFPNFAKVGYQTTNMRPVIFTSELLASTGTFETFLHFWKLDMVTTLGEPNEIPFPTSGPMESNGCRRILTWQVFIWTYVTQWQNLCPLQFQHM